MNTTSPPPTHDVAQKPQSWPVRKLGAIGRGTLEGLGYAGGLLLLGRDTLGWVKRSFRSKRRSRRRELVYQMVRVGVRSIPLVSVVLLFIGMILALQMAYVLQTLGFTHWVGAIVGVAIFRELGPLISAMTLAGLVGASIAAELAAMVDQEEVAAMEVMALPPIWYLVMPRALACMIMLPIVTLIADFVGVFGGWAVSVGIVGLPSASYVNKMLDQTVFKDVWTGIVKSEVFAIVIVLLACYEGLHVKGGAEDVGRATTRAVVLSIVSIIAIDCAFTALFYYT
jgi:phospholipid/cholesterol/gamma-HCH transport system permease protein